MIALTLLRSTALSMFYIACCAFVLMKHNVLCMVSVAIFTNLLRQLNYTRCYILVFFERWLITFDKK